MGLFVYIVLLILIVLFFGPLFIGFMKYLLSCFSKDACDTDVILSSLQDMFDFTVGRIFELFPNGDTKK